MIQKQQQLTFEKGITNVPSDAVCSDNTLADAVGLVYDDGEHRAIQKPLLRTMSFLSHTLRFVHTSAQSSRYISDNGNALYFTVNPDLTHLITENGFIMTYTGELSIEAVGNTLVVASDDGIRYARWNGTNYDVVGQLPEIQFVPYMNEGHPELKRKIHSFTHFRIGYDRKYITSDGAVTDSNSTGRHNTYVFSSPADEEADSVFQDACTGAMEEFINQLEEGGAFVFPFWVRFALVLYDGSVTRQTQPVLMMPSVRAACYMKMTDTSGKSPEAPEDTYPAMDNSYGNFTADSNSAFLWFYTTQALPASLKDIVAGVKVYISQPVRTQNINNNKWKVYNPAETDEDTELKLLTDNVYGTTNSLGLHNNDSYYRRTLMPARPNVVPGAEQRGFYESYLYPEQRSDREIINSLNTTTVFYEVAEIPFEELRNTGKIFKLEELMEKNTLNNLTTMTQMPHDDFFSHAVTAASKLFTYNSRLNMFDVRRKAFGGFTRFMALDYQYYQTPAQQEPTQLSAYSVVIDVDILTDNGTVTARATADIIRTHQGLYFFYPDTRATKATLYIKDSGEQYYKYAEMPLKQHQQLNGAYYFGALPSAEIGNTLSLSGQTVSLPDVETSTEYLPNLVITTEVNNPMVSYAEGYNYIGTGTVLGLATQTVALSSGTEHGALPLIIFTDKGLFAMKVDSTGLFQSISPMAREVCSNPKSITQVDGAVFFASRKGLMLVHGEQTECVSQQINGFAEFLLKAFIAYDYRDSLLWIFDGTTDTQGAFVGNTECYVFNIRTRTFSRFSFEGQVVKNAVNDYPDYLLHDTTGNVFTLIGRPAQHEDTNTYEATMTTRPLKLENALALKSIMQLRHITAFSVPLTASPTVPADSVGGTTAPSTPSGGSTPSLALRIFASNNLTSWVELHSLRGTPWKYYRFRYDFTRLSATDRFAGTLLVTQERRTGKLR